MVRIRPARTAPSDEVDAAFADAASGDPAPVDAGGVVAGGDAAGGGANEDEGWRAEPKSGDLAGGGAGGPAVEGPLDAGAGNEAVAGEGAANAAGAGFGLPPVDDGVVARELSVGLANATRSVAIVGTIAMATRPPAASEATSKVTLDPSDVPGTGLAQSYFGVSLHAPSCAGLNDSAPGARAQACTDSAAGGVPAIASLSLPAVWSEGTS